MPTDVFGPQIERMFKQRSRGENPRGVTVMEVVESLGCTSGRVYQWLRKNEWRMRRVGGSAGAGGVRWVLDESRVDPTREARRIQGVKGQRGRGGGRGQRGRGGGAGGDLPAVRVGAALEVVGIESVDVEAGVVTVALTDVAGRRVRAVLARA